MSPAVVPWRAAAAHAERPAIADGEVVWTHGRLAARVDAWAAVITALPDSGAHVALQMSHGAEAIAAWLGIIAAGRAALVLDPQQPASARAAALAFAEAGVLLAPLADAQPLRDAGFRGHVVAPADVRDDGPAVAPAPARGGPDARACLYVTSGTTGAPKAVVWTQRTLAAAARYLDAMFGFVPTDRHALVAPLAVAATAAQVTACLAAGACLRLREARRHATADLAAWLRHDGITTMQTVPSLHRALSADAPPWPTLRALKLGGETVTVADARRFEAIAAAGAMLINGLGLTEAGFNVCWWTWRAGDPLDGAVVPVGRASPDVELRLDGDEIVVAATTLADGYWRDPARTAARYRALPGRPGWRELHTGDAGRWRADGVLEHRGRLDLLVKVRGHRVDPGEVEAVLLALDGVAEAAVVPVHDDDVRLCAFVRLWPGAALTPVALHRALAARLPAHMLPAPLRVVDTLPRLEGGKVDRGALLQQAARGDASGDDVAPRDALERTVLACFRRVLPRQTFGVTASFFDLGGDSLAAAELFTALSALLRVELPLADLVRHPTVEQLAARIRAAGAHPSADPVALLSPSPDRGATNLFMWPGAGSDVMALADLARHLGPTVALHAIQHRGADGRRVYDATMEQMAERGAALVRRVQPRGPYVLCGTSFGGLVALEVARRLRRDGEAVPVLALLDSYAPGYPAPRRDLGARDRTRLLRRALRPLGHKDEPGWAVLRRGLREQVLRLRARLAVGRARPDAPPLPPSTRFIHLQEACFRVTRALRLAPYDGPVQLFRVDSPPPADLFQLDATLGWRAFLTGPLAIDVIPGRHSWHLREPNVQTLAAKLRAVMASAQRPAVDGWDAPALWDELAAWWDGHVGNGGSAAFRDVALAELERLIDVRPGERVLDVACGTGWLSRRLAGRGACVTAVDASEGMLRHARARGGAIEFRRMDVTSPDELQRLEGAAYDLAVCNLALHDLSDVRPLFVALARTVRADGRLVLSVVHPARMLRDGVPPDVPALRLAVPDQPRPHVEVTRPLPDLWRLAAVAGFRLEALRELPDGDDPAFALARLRLRP